MIELKINKTIYRYKNTEWLGKSSNKAHCTIFAEYFVPRLNIWREVINWCRLDEIIAIRNNKVAA